MHENGTFKKVENLVLGKYYPYIFSKENFSYIFSKESFSYISGNGTLHFSARAQKIKKPPRKILLYFRKRKPQKISYVSAKRNSKKASYIINLQSLKLKYFYTFPYKEAKFSKSKYFCIIIIKRFFSFYNIFFYTQQAFVFHLLRDFCNVHDHIVASFSFSSIERF